MLSNDDHPGIFYFLVGMIVLVFAAVGLSIAVEKRVSFSSGMGEIKRDLAATTSELAALKIQFESRSATLREQQEMLQVRTGNHQKFQAEIGKSTARKSELLALKEKLSSEISGMDTAFSDYRSNYRNSTWTRAIGESYPRLAMRGGRDYKDVTITKVTEVGLEIRHENGNARIQAPDLDAGWQERFQWDDEERRAHLKEEDARLAAPVVAVQESPPIEDSNGFEVRPQGPSPGAANEAEKLATLNALRKQVIGWKSKVSVLTSERSMAVSNAGRNNQTSVPGSLETWSAKAARLGNELVRAQVELAQAKAKLAAVSPSDALLRTTYDPNF